MWREENPFRLEIESLSYTVSIHPGRALEHKTIRHEPYRPFLYATYGASVTSVASKTSNNYIDLERMAWSGRHTVRLWLRDLVFAVAGIGYFTSYLCFPSTTTAGS